MKYTKIKHGTEAWELMNKIFTFPKKWKEHQEEIEAFLGFTMYGTIAFDINNLYVDRYKLEKNRPEWLSEFRKNDDPSPAKTKSKVKAGWIALCERLGLEAYKTSDFTWKYGLLFIGQLTYHKQDENYLISLDSETYDFSQHDWAEIVDEPTFLRMRADFLEKQKSA